MLEHATQASDSGWEIYFYCFFSCSTNPMGVTNQEFINRAALHHQPGPGDHDPRNDVLTSAKRAEEAKHLKYDATCAATGSNFSPFALETTGKETLTHPSFGV